MAATVDIYEYNGAGPTGTAKGGLTVRYKHADNATVDTANPLVKPSSGNFDRSYIKSLRLRCTTAAGAQASNVKAYTDGTSGFGTGITLYAKATSTSTYTQATADATGTGEGSTWMDFFGYTSGSSLSLGAGPYTLADATPFANYLETYMKLADTVTAPQNPTSSETFTFGWDEV